jgi:hypothetical protein
MPATRSVREDSLRVLDEAARLLDGADTDASAVARVVDLVEPCEWSLPARERDCGRYDGPLDALRDVVVAHAPPVRLSPVFVTRDAALI